MSPSQAKPLSVEAIVDAATRISETDGFETISMRRLADELGVTAMALYGYVSTKEELLGLVADRYIAELDLAEDAEDWDERLARVFRSLFELLMARPILAHVLTHQTVDAPAAYRTADVVIGILRDHGFDDETAVEIARILAAYTVGMALSRGPRVAAEADDAKRVRHFREATDFPNLSAVADSWVRWPDELFEHGLDLLIHAQTGPGESAAPRPANPPRPRPLR